jgi:hypothetical protein
MFAHIQNVIQDNIRMAYIKTYIRYSLKSGYCGLVVPIQLCAKYRLFAHDYIVFDLRMSDVVHPAEKFVISCTGELIMNNTTMMITVPKKMRSLLGFRSPTTHHGLDAEMKIKSVLRTNDNIQDIDIYAEIFEELYGVRIPENKW